MTKKLHELMIRYDHMRDSDRYDEKIELSTQIIALAEDNKVKATAFNNRGIAYVNKLEYDQAISDYDQAIQLKPDFKQAIHNRAAALVFKSTTNEQKEIKQQYEKQLEQQKQEFKKQMQQYAIDIMKSGGYKDREAGYQEDFKKASDDRDKALKSLRRWSSILYGSIATLIVASLFGWFGIQQTTGLGLFKFFPLVIVASLILVPLVWGIRWLNNDSDKYLALKEDAYTKGN